MLACLYNFDSLTVDSWTDARTRDCLTATAGTGHVACREDLIKLPEWLSNITRLPVTLVSVCVEGEEAAL